MSKNKKEKSPVLDFLDFRTDMPELGESINKSLKSRRKRIRNREGVRAVMGGIGILTGGLAVLFMGLVVTVIPIIGIVMLLQYFGIISDTWALIFYICFGCILPATIIYEIVKNRADE